MHTDKEQMLDGLADGPIRCTGTRALAFQFEAGFNLVSDNNLDKFAAR
jgi:hypothetical protein